MCAQPAVITSGTAVALTVGMNKPTIETSSKLMKQAPKGKLAMPMLLWIAGVPFGLVLVLWFFFFRG